MLYSVQLPAVQDHLDQQNGLRGDGLIQPAIQPIHQQSQQDPEASAPGLEAADQIFNPPIFR